MDQWYSLRLPVDGLRAERGDADRPVDRRLIERVCVLHAGTGSHQQRLSRRYLHRLAVNEDPLPSRNHERVLVELRLLRRSGHLGVRERLARCGIVESDVAEAVTWARQEHPNRDV